MLTSLISFPAYNELSALNKQFRQLKQSGTRDNTLQYRTAAPSDSDYKNSIKFIRNWTNQARDFLINIIQANPSTNLTRAAFNTLVSISQNYTVSIEGTTITVKNSLVESFIWNGKTYKINAEGQLVDDRNNLLINHVLQPCEKNLDNSFSIYPSIGGFQPEKVYATITPGRKLLLKKYQINL
jgi:hypothetical protein